MGESRASDNVGRLSVDVLADLTQFDSALGEVEERLGKIPTEKMVKVSVSGITETQLKRLRTAAELMERIQKTGIKPEAVAAAPTKGGSSAAPAETNVSFKEADLTEALRAAAVAAFKAPISGVRLDLDLAHLQGQLSKLKINFTGNLNAAQSGPHEQQASTPYTGPRTVSGLAPLVNDPKQQEAARTFYRELNQFFKSKGQPMLNPARDTAEEFVAIADRLGDAMNKVVKFASADPDRDFSPTGGAIHKLLKDEPDDIKYGPLAQAASSYQFAFRSGRPWDAYRAAGPAMMPPAQQQAPPPPPVPASVEHQAALANLQAAEATKNAAHRAQQQAEATPPVAGPAKQFEPISLDDLNSLMPYIAGRTPKGRTTPYEPYVAPPENETAEEKRLRERQIVTQRRGARDAQNQRLSVSSPPSTPPIDVREFVSGRRSFGATGLSAIGQIVTSKGTDISDLLIAGGLHGDDGRKFFESFGEPQKGGKGTGAVIPLTTQEIDRLKTMPGQTGRAGNRSQVKLLGPSELLRLLLVNNRGVSPTEAKGIASWAVSEGAPLNARYLGGGDEDRSLIPISGGSRSVVREAQDRAQMQRDQRRLGELLLRQQELREQLAGTGVPSEQRRYSGALGSVAGQIGRLTRSLSSPLEDEANVRASEENQASWAAMHQFEPGAIDASSKFGTTVGDRPKLIEALRFLGSNKGTSDRSLAEVQKTLNDLIQGTLPPGEDPSSVGGFAGARTAGTMLHSQMRLIYEGVMAELGLPPTKRGGTKAMRGSLERQGDVQTAAGFDLLQNELRTRRELAKQDTAGDRSGMSERAETTDHDRAYTRAPGAEPPADTIKTRTHRGDVASAPIFERQNELDAIERRMAAIGSRSGSVAHDPMAMGRRPANTTLDFDARSYPEDELLYPLSNKGKRLAGPPRVIPTEGPPELMPQPGAPGGGFEERGQIGEGKILGKHAQVLQPVTGEISKRELRIREQVAREMGVKFGSGEDAGKPVMPNSGKLSEAEFEQAVKTAIASDPDIANLQSELGGLAVQRQDLQNQRKAFMAAARPQIVTPAPKVRSGDDERRGFFKTSGAAPQGGVPVTPEEIRSGKVGPPSMGMPAWTVAGAASQAGPSVTSALVGAAMMGGAGEGGGGGAPMRSGGQIHVWVDNPELTVKVIGGSARVSRSKRIQDEMDAGNTAESQRLNVEEGVARGGSVESGGAIKKGRGKGAINLDEMRAAEAASQAGPRRAVADVVRELHRAIRSPQLLLPATASAGTTQQPPMYGADWMRQPGAQKGAGFAPANSIFYGQAPGGGGAEIGSAADAAKVERERRNQAKVAGAAVRRPSRTELLNALAGAGADTDTLSRFATPINTLELNAGRGSTDILKARQAAKEAQARLPSRALSTSIVQLSQRVFGGREEPEQRIFQLQRFTSRLQALDTRGLTMRTQRAESFLAERRAREEIRTRQRSGQAVPEALTREFEGAREAVKNHTKEIKENSANISKAAGKVAELGAKAVTSGDVLRNLAAGFVGGVGGSLVTMGVAGAAGAALAAAGVVQEALKPAYEAAIGYQQVTNQVVDSLSDQLRANHGLAVETIALAASQAGLSDGVYKSIAPQLRQAATVEAGNKAYGDYIGMVRAAERIGVEGPRGVFHATGGLNVLGVQTPIGGTPSTMENFLDQFNGVARPTSDSILGLPNFSADALTNAGMQIGELGTRVGDWIRNIDPTVAPEYKGDQARAGETQSGPTMATRLTQINDQLDGINSSYRITNDASKDIAAANQAQADVMRGFGVDEGKIASFQQLGVAFTDTAGNIITSGEDIVAAWDAMARSFTQVSPTTFLDQSRGAMQGQIWGLGAQGNLQRSQLMQQFALNRLANPPVYGAQVFGGLGAASAPTGFTQGYMPGMAQSMPLGVLNAQLQQTGEGQLQTAINNIPDPLHRAQASALVPQLTEVGRLIHDAQVDSQKIQLAQQFRAWNYQLDLSKRNLGDVIGLNGKMNQGGVSATDFGQLQYQAQQLQHTMQNQQFDHAQLSLNYQKALAGFLAPGATGEEIATRVRIAEKETKFQQTQLNENRSLADNQWQQTLIGNSRMLQAASHDYTELQTQIIDAGRLFANQDIISQASEAQSAIVGTLQAYLDEGNGMVGIANQYTQQLVALGKTADEAMADSILRLQEAAVALYTAKTTIDSSLVPLPGTDPYLGPPAPLPGESDTNLGPPAPKPYIPFFETDPAVGGGAGLTDPYMTPMLTSGKQTQQVIINNPSAGVDTAALTRVVINELNRQGSLRNSPLG